MELDPRVFKQLSDCGSVLRLFMHASRDKVSKLRTEHPVVRELWRAHILQVLYKFNEISQFRVRVNPGSQLNNNQTEAPNITCVRVSIAEYPLRTHVDHRPDESIAKSSRVRKLTTDSEVTELYFPAGADQHVVRLDVSVDHVFFFVQVVKTSED